MKTFFQITGIALFAILVVTCGNRSLAQKDTESSEERTSITGKYWKLIEINGKPVVLDESIGSEPFIILRNEDRRVNGSGGCNTISGSFEISEGNRIKFSQMATSLKACLNMEFEEALKKALDMADNYSLSDDGKYLSLNRARMAPLARFEVVYLR